MPANPIHSVTSLALKTLPFLSLLKQHIVGLLIHTEKWKCNMPQPSHNSSSNNKTCDGMKEEKA